MNIDFKIYKYDYKNKIRLQDKKASGVVKSVKNFPIFKENKKEYIFKPLSKTKPLLTPLFGISEVFWSTVINNFFDENAPIYRLAYCDNMELENKYPKGVIVESIIDKDEKLVNLLEYYNSNPDKKVDIENYINYCGIYYDYTNILQSKIFSNNNKLGTDLAKQILISILKNDINYHYENVAFKYRDNKLVDLASPIDHEFSSFFIFPDNPKQYVLYFGAYNMEFLFESFSKNMQNENIIKNINLICNLYPEVSKEFLDNLAKFINTFKYYNFTLPSEYLEPLSSDMYKVYKYGEDIKYIKLTNIDIKEYSKAIKNDILVCAHSFYTYLSSQLNNKILCKK